MDIFAIRDEVVDGYREFTTSFVDPHDERIRNFVTDQMDKGAQWPDPRISLACPASDAAARRGGARGRRQRRSLRAVRRP